MESVRNRAVVSPNFGLKADSPLEQVEHGTRKGQFLVGEVWRLADKKLTQDQSQRVNIRLCADSAPELGFEESLDLFRRHVGKGAAQHSRLRVLGRVWRLGEIEIEQLRSMMKRDQNVARLDVMVKRLHRVCISERPSRAQGEPCVSLRIRPLQREILPSVTLRTIAQTRCSLSLGHERLPGEVRPDEGLPKDYRRLRSCRRIDPLDDFIKGQ